MEKLKFDYKIVKPTEIVPNTWNPKKDNPEKYAEVIDSIKTYGLSAPITVREFEGKYQVIDGFHRWKACTELGFEEVVINNLGVIDDSEAKRLTIVFQKVGVPFDEIMYSQLIKELSEEMSEEDILATLPLTEPELGGYLKMSDFDFNAEYEDDELTPEMAEKARGLTITFSEEQSLVVRQAIDKIKGVARDETLSDSRAIELLGADYLADQNE